MKAWNRPLAYFAVIAVIAIAYFVGRSGRGPDVDDAGLENIPDPGYAALDAEVIETGYDGQERYRLKAKVIRQQTETAAIELEQLEMNYHPGTTGSQRPRPGEGPPAGAGETWHLTSDRGEVRADGDDVQLSGNVVITGPARGDGEPLILTTSELRINTPTEYIETDAPLRVRWSGHEWTARGLKADLKAGTLRLESEVHGEFSPK